MEAAAVNIDCVPSTIQSPQPENTLLGMSATLPVTQGGNHAEVNPVIKKLLLYMEFPEGLYSGFAANIASKLSQSLAECIDPLYVNGFHMRVQPQLSLYRIFVSRNYWILFCV